MKAIINKSYGTPDVMEMDQVVKPTPSENEVLVKVVASSANPMEWRITKGKPLLVRLEEGLFRPRNKILGADIAGIVEAVGSSITQFKVGDEVFGDISRGGFAEYVCVPQEDLVRKPANITFEQAAAVPVAGLTALQSLRCLGPIAHDKKVLINGASGGVGTFAVQIAKAFGAEITGVCSYRNLELVKSIGADHVMTIQKRTSRKTEFSTTTSLMPSGIGQ